MEAVAVSKHVNTAPNNLPLQVNRFIGREREVTAVKGLLAATRLLVLTGAGERALQGRAVIGGEHIVEQHRRRGVVEFDFTGDPDGARANRPLTSTLIRRKAEADSGPPSSGRCASAARCTTAVAPRNALSIARSGRCVRSPTGRNCARAAVAGSSWRTSPRTPYPAAARRGTTARPRNPFAPVTTIVIQNHFQPCRR